MHRVAVTLVNWNEYERTLECVARLRESDGVAARVLVVDNDSGGGEAERLRDRSEVDAVLALPDNRGYAGGMNAGLEYWHDRQCADPILILTPDVALEPDAVRKLAEALEASPGAGAAGPLVVYREAPMRLVGAGGSIEPHHVRAGLLREPREPAAHEVDWIDGCCMLLRPDAAAATGGFDERYFIYFEETDLCHRLRRRGWSVLLRPDAVARHPKEETVQPAYYYYYMSRNRFLFWRKNFGVGFPRVAWTVAAATVSTFASWLRSLAVPRLWPESPARLRRCARQLGGATAGTRDHLRGRYGRKPGRHTAASESSQL